MDEDVDPYVPPKRNEGKKVPSEFVRFALRLRIVPVCLSIIVGLLAVLWTLGGAYAYLTSGPPIDWELFLPFWIFTGLFLGLINFLAAWCWMKGHFFGGFIANLCSPLPLGVFVIYMEMFEPTF
ncbi:MAG TPA: hypothetical protein EYM79_12825 [Planctomycetes bacterium]|nr:hypothetical protein [Planctomycetaceae bacterium]HIN55184.1 hypothetical protein [Planctomycetota bacterium]